MITALTKLVGKENPTVIKALTDLIPKKQEDQEFSGAANNIVPLRNSILSLLELDDLVEENTQLVKKTKASRIATDESEDWSYILNKLGNLIDNLHKFLSNLRNQEYYKNVYLEFEEKEIERRNNILKEKLLDKTTEVEEVEAKTDVTDREKIEKLKGTLVGLGFTAAGLAAAGLPPPGAELDAATLAQVRASGADLIAAAHLATLEASSPQHVADVMQVILNRARGQSGGIPAVITAREQFSPYSAAIYGVSADKAAEAKYGQLRVSKAEIFQLASQSNGLQALTNRFNAGNPGVAAQVLMDIKSGGPLSTSAKQFVGGAQYFTGYNVQGSRRRPDGGNYFRDKYSAGSIIVPELFDAHRIDYDTVRKPNLISNFIVDRPTIIDMKDVGEPLIIIPLGRPIGRTILKMIFDRPFNIIENKFSFISKQQQEKVRRYEEDTKNSTITERSQIADTRPEISISSSTSQSTSQSSSSATPTTSALDIQPSYDMNQITPDYIIPIKALITPVFLSVNPTEASTEKTSEINQLEYVPPTEELMKQTYIDNNISNQTENIFNKQSKVVILTQDIIYQEQ